MKRISLARRPIRTQFTKAVNLCETLVQADPVNVDEVKVKFETIGTLMERLSVLDREMSDAMLDSSETTEEAMNTELEEVIKYRESFSTICSKVDKVIPKDAAEPADNATVYGSAASSKKKVKNAKLPKKDLKKFNGDLGNWLGWWSSFVQIHDDEDLHDADKFDYLSSCMISGSEAAELVESYPQSVKNYPEVIEALKERYGREDLLLQYYLRQLLELVISNVYNEDKIPLPTLFNKLSSHLRSLETLNLAKADPDTWLYPLVESSLSRETSQAWQRSSLSKEDGSLLNPKKTKLNLLMEFMKAEVRNEQQITLAQSGFQSKEVIVKSTSKSKAAKVKPEEIATVAGLPNGQAGKCEFCEKTHDTDRCATALSMTMEDRRKIVKDKHLCYQCLRSGHSSKKCKLVVKCAVCGGKHYPIVCLKLSGAEAETRQTTRGAAHFQQQNNSPPQMTAQNANNCSGNVLLNTVWVTMMGGNKKIRARLVGDNCSQRSYIRTSALNKINRIQVGGEWLQNVVFGNITTEPAYSGRYRVQLQHNDKNSVEVLELLEREEICGALPKIPHGPWISELAKQGIKLSDYGTGCEDVDILIGNDHWGKILTTSPIIKLDSGLYAQETIFGWTLGGTLPKQTNSCVTTVINNVCTTSDLTTLFSLEALGVTDPVERKTLKQEENEAHDFFLKTVTRNSNGRYIVALPWKTDCEDLPTNRLSAEKQLKRCTYKLKKMEKWKDYDKVFQDWEKEGLIATVDFDDDGHFLPHRPVFKNSASTPVRPVYNASCRDSNSCSLNDCLHKGPNLLELIPSLLLRFREKEVGVTSDIRKAFQMIQVREEDKKFQKFLWWKDSEGAAIKVYQHNRVVFGINCSPYLLSATINYHLESQVPGSPTVNMLKRSWYVDNCVLSVDSMKDYHHFKQEATSIMKEAGMELRQWTCSLSPSSGVGSSLVEECGLDDGSNQIHEEQAASVMVLGMIWNREKDVLSCEIKDWNLPAKITKRKILSVISQIFDPLGLLSPTTLVPKLILQDIWTRKCGWDETLPKEICSSFLKWVEEAALLREFQIPRHMQVANALEREVHVFVDASGLSYACVLYLRTKLCGSVKVELIMAKSRLAPIKKCTIPRLELMACLLGARMYTNVRDAIDMMGVEVYFWTDSTTALAWIQRDVKCEVFVRNRRKEIREHTDPKQWAHIPGEYNPADLPSRSCTPVQLLKCVEWKEGPEWMKYDKEKWPVSNVQPDEDEVNVEVKIVALCVSLISSETVKYSSYEKNIRVWSWIHRYFLKCRKLSNKKGKLSLMDLRNGERFLWKLVQASSFGSYSSAVGGIQVKADKEGLLRVVTRLTNRKDTSDFIAPILIPKKHPLTESLILSFHRVNNHAGVQILTSKLREKYWIIQSRRTIRRVLKKCATCQRYNVKNADAPPGPLPEKRVMDSEPYETVGVDLAGPLFLKDGSKTWIVVFTCAVYRCIHLDLVTSCSSEAFLGALERFIAHYGRPNTIFSDNGCNFVGSDTIFSTLDWKSIEEESRTKRIKWVFNPPTAAWWGGFWERLIREVKNLLKRMLGRARLNYDQLRTCVAGITATLNDRPLTLLTEDNNDLVALTPAMFVRGRAIGHLVEIGKAQTLTAAYKKMKALQARLQDRFRREYLGLLVQRGNEKGGISLSVGDIVLVGADNKKRFEWPLGKIVELIKSPADQVVRVAKVKTKNGILTRPVQRLYPLEIRTEEEVKKPEVQVGDDDDEEVKVEEEEPVVQTKFGRVVKRPSRYGQCLSFMI